MNCIFCGGATSGPVCYACRLRPDGDEVVWAMPAIGQVQAVPQPTERKGPWRKEVIPRPQLHLSRISGQFPKFWKRYEELRAERKRLGDWPAWCYCPAAGAYAIVSGGRQLSIREMPLVPELAAVAAWRPTKGVYRFDPDLFEALTDTPIDGAIPSDVLHRLPEWCVYIETRRAGWSFDGRPIHGFFSHFEHDANDGSEELRVLFDCTTDDLLTVITHLVPGGTLQDGITRSTDLAWENARKMGLPDSIGHQFHQQMAQTGPLLAKCLSLLLYLCSDHPDYDGDRTPTIPGERTTKKGVRQQAPCGVTEWNVGVRVGAALRSAQPRTAEPGGDQHASPRPHFRRAHWHTYWTGKGRTIPALRWIAPTIVGGDGVIPVIRPVEKARAQ